MTNRFLRDSSIGLPFRTMLAEAAFRRHSIARRKFARRTARTRLTDRAGYRAPQPAGQVVGCTRAANEIEENRADLALIDFRRSALGLASTKGS